MSNDQETEAYLLAKDTNCIIAIAYLAYSFFLFRAIPNFNSVYLAMFSNWDSIENFNAQLLHIPGFIWLLSYSALGFIAYFCGKFCSKQHLKWVNYSFLAILFISFAITIRAACAFVFSHAWD